MTAIDREKAFRDSVRAKYGYKCAACGLPQHVQKAKNGRALSVHRVRPGADYSVAGCVPLCMSCHSRAHGYARRGADWRNPDARDPIVMPSRIAVVPCGISAEAFGLLRIRAVELDMPERTLAALLLEQAIRAESEK